VRQFRASANYKLNKTHFNSPRLWDDASKWSQDQRGVGERSEEVSVTRPRCLIPFAAAVESELDTDKCF
jgi:hypothetical protein